MYQFNAIHLFDCIAFQRRSFFFLLFQYGSALSSRLIDPGCVCVCAFVRL